MEKRRQIIIVSSIIALLVVIDYITKIYAQDILMGSGAISYLGGFIRFIYAENTGGMLGLGDELPWILRFILFRIFVFIMLAALFYYYVVKKNIPFFQLFAVTIFIAGGVGNLLDRIIYDGVVIDFILMELLGFHTGIFNLADMFVTTSVIMIIFSKYVLKEDEEKETSTEISGTEEKLTDKF